MKVIIPKFSGFCPGVKQAEQRLLSSEGKQDLVILGELIHNTDYISYLDSLGIQTVDQSSTVKEDTTLVIRTHGINREKETAIRKKHSILDLTCFKVKALQNAIRDAAQQKKYIILTGKKEHPEILGLVSYAEHYTVISSEDELGAFIHSENNKDTQFYGCESVYIASQTTGDLSLFQKTCNTISSEFGNTYNIEINNSICGITELREKAAEEAMQECDIAFVVGDKKSSNAKKLFHRLKERQKPVYFIANRKDLEDQNISTQGCKTALVVSSSSTPDFIEKGITDYLTAL
ncbi:MAG: hypothetical protein ACLFR1_02355 [Spirochaetia bacterium]